MPPPLTNTLTGSGSGLGGASVKVGFETDKFVEGLKKIRDEFKETLTSSEAFKKGFQQINVEQEKFRKTLASTSEETKKSTVGLKELITAFAALVAATKIAATLAGGFENLWKIIQTGAANSIKFFGDFRAALTTYGRGVDDARKSTETFTASQEKVGQAVAKTSLVMGLFGTLVASVVLPPIANLVQFIGEKLAPDLTALTIIVEQQSEAMVKLGTRTREFATALTEGQRLAAAPFRDAIASIGAALIPTNKVLVEHIGFLGQYASVAAQVASAGISVVNVLAQIGGTIGIIQVLLRTQIFAGFIAELNKSGVAVTGLSTFIQALARVSLVALGSVLVDLKSLLTSIFPTFIRFGQIIASTALSLGASPLGLAFIVGTVLVGAFLLLNKAFADTGSEAQKTLSVFDRIRERSKDLGDQLERSFKGITVQLRELRSAQAQLLGLPGAGIEAAQLSTSRQRQQFQEGIDQLVEGMRKTSELTKEENTELERLATNLGVAGRAIINQLGVIQETNARYAEQVELVQRGVQQKLAAADVDQLALERARASKQLELQILQSRGTSTEISQKAAALQQEILELEKQIQGTSARRLQIQSEAGREELRLLAEKRVAQDRDLQRLDEQSKNYRFSREELEKQTSELQKQEKILQQLRDQAAITAKSGFPDPTVLADLAAQQAIVNQLKIRVEFTKQLEVLDEQRQRILASVGITEEKRAGQLDDIARREQEINTALKVQDAQKKSIEASQGNISRLQTEQLQNTKLQVEALERERGEAAGRLKLLQDQFKLEEQSTAINRQNLENQLALAQANEDTLKNREKILGIQRQLFERDRDLLEIQQRLLKATRDVFELDIKRLEAKAKLAGLATDEGKRAQLEAEQLRLQLELIDKQLQSNAVSASRITGQLQLVGRELARLNQIPFNLGDTIRTSMNDALSAVVLGTRKISEVFEGLKFAVVRQFVDMFAQMVAQKLQFDTLWINNWLTTIPQAVAAGASKAVGFIGQIFGGGGASGGGGGGGGLIPPGTTFTSGFTGGGSSGLNIPFLSGNSSIGPSAFFSQLGTLAAIAFTGAFTGKLFANFLGVGKTRQGARGAQIAGALLGGIFGPVGGVIGDAFAPQRIAIEKKDIEKFLEQSFGFNIPRKNLDKFLPEGEKNFGEFRPSLGALATDFTLQQKKGGIGTLKRFGNLAIGGFQEAGLTDEEAKQKILQLAEAVGFNLTKAFGDLNKALNGGFKDKNNRLTLAEYNEEVKEGQKNITTYGALLKGTFEILTGFSDKVDEAALANNLLADRFREVAEANGDYNEEIQALAKNVREGVIPLEEAINKLNAFRESQGKGKLELKDFEVSLEKTRLEFVRLGIAVDDTSEKALGFVDQIFAVDEALKQVGEQIKEVDRQLRDLKFEGIANLLNIRQGLESRRPGSTALPSQFTAQFRRDVSIPQFGAIAGFPYPYGIPGFGQPRTPFAIPSDPGIPGFGRPRTPFAIPSDLGIPGFGQPRTPFAVPSDQGIPGFGQPRTPPPAGLGLADRLGKLDLPDLQRLSQINADIINSFFAEFDQKLQEKAFELGKARDLEASRLTDAANAQLKALNEAQKAAQKAANARLEALRTEAELIQKVARERLDALQKELEVAQAFRTVGESLKQNILALVTSPASTLAPGQQLAFLQRQTEQLRGQLQGATGVRRAELFAEIQQLLNQVLQVSGAFLQRPSDQYTKIFGNIIKELERMRDEAIKAGAKVESIQEQARKLQEETNKKLAALNKEAEAISKALDDLTEKNQAAAEAIRAQLEKDLKALNERTEKEFEAYKKQLFATLKEDVERAIAVQKEIDEAIRKKLEEQKDVLLAQEKELREFRTTLTKDLASLLKITQEDIVQLLADIRKNTRKPGDVAAQHGFEGIVTQATRFLAGESGPERVSIQPLTRASGQTIIVQLASSTQVTINTPAGMPLDTRKIANDLALLSEESMIRRVRSGRLGQAIKEVVQQGM